MPAASKGYAIRQDLQTIIRGLALDGITSANVKLRKLPKSLETIDPLPCVCICSGPMGFNRLSFEAGQVDRIYTVDIVLIDANEGDYATDEDKQLRWQEQVIGALLIDPATSDVRFSLPSVATVWQLELDQATTFDRSKLSELYDYLGVRLRVHSHE
jgi:hypothetical protein